MQDGPAAVNNMHHTIEQERAQLAWQQVTEVRNRVDFDKYQTYATSASVLIQTNGLLQALVFWKSKAGNGDAYSKLLEHISHALGFGGSIDLLITTIKDADVSSYRQNTNEVLSFLVWLKRFVN